MFCTVADLVLHHHQKVLRDDQNTAMVKIVCFSRLKKKNQDLVTLSQHQSATASTFCPVHVLIITTTYSFSMVSPCLLSAKPRKIRFQDDDVDVDSPEKDTRLKLGKGRKKKGSSGASGGVSALQARMLQMAGQEVPDAPSESSSSDSESEDEREESVS